MSNIPAFRLASVLIILSVTLCTSRASAQFREQGTTPPEIRIDTSAYNEECEISVRQIASRILVEWQLAPKLRGQFIFELDDSRPLIRQVSIASGANTGFREIARNLEPFLQLRIGNRDLEKRSGWTIFFDRMQRKPSEVFIASVEATRAVVNSKANRATLTIGNVSAGPFQGELRWTFYSGSSFILQEAVMKTDREATAYLYDTGLLCKDGNPTQLSWHDSQGELQVEKSELVASAKSIAVRGRAIAAQFPSGSLGVFPPPHRYFYPLDFSNNLKNIWLGPNYGEQSSDRSAVTPPKSTFGFGIRHDAQGDNRYVPWFNAPPGSKQEMGVFLMLSDGSSEQVLDRIARLTRKDRFAEIPGHKVFTSHFHVEHTLDFLSRSREKTYREIVPTSRKEAQAWQYTNRSPAKDWNQPQFDASAWKSGQAGFGSKGTKGLRFGTNWTSSDIWLRRKFMLSEKPDKETRIIMQHDEDTEVYLNGVLAASVTGFTPEYRDFAIRGEALQALHAGENVIAIHCQNDGGGQAIDAGLGLSKDTREAIPPGLENPGFVQVFKRLGVDIVHLAEFHNGRTPKLDSATRLQQLKTMHQECARLSDEELLLLPGEEPNVHLGGHWISFFPKPVYWVLNRPGDKPFVSEHPELGRVYHVGSEADVLQLLRAEGGLAWTAHPRIKSSTGFPDRYRDRPFYQTESFLGGAWKAMPADLSKPRLGSRVLDLLSDMSNWGPPKAVLGEVDVFKIEPDHEIYAHMNVNYLRLEKTPKFQDGWQPVLDALRGGQFFVTTGEVLIPKFTVSGAESGELAIAENGQAEVLLELEWTFPLAYAEIITGDGRTVQRKQVDLSHTQSFGKESLKIDVDVAGKRWLRVEVWDIATNGAFTQPVWFGEP